MIGSLRLLMVPLAAAGLLALAGGALASKAARPDPGKYGVIDNANVFSKEAKEKADERIKAMANRHGRGLLIETMDAPPESWKDKLQAKDDRKANSGRFARERYNTHDVHGVYVVISKDPKFLATAAGDRTAAAGYNADSQEALRTAFRTHFNDSKYDEGLLAAVAKAETQFSSLRDPAPPRTSPRAAAADSEPIGVVGWVIIALVALVGIWLVVGLLRAFSGGGGGGGGGFFSSLLGGLFGAALGMYMYHSFFGGHAYGNDYGGGYGGDSGPSDDNASAGGGDDYGGGDAGGGGDWGGGGGGDWGGGGGDWGGGGGGDW